MNGRLKQEEDEDGSGVEMEVRAGRWWRWEGDWRGSVIRERGC